MNARARDLEILVEELTKIKPSTEKLKILTKKCGLRYHQDIIEQMQIVFNEVEKQTGRSLQVPSSRLKNLEGV